VAEVKAKCRGGCVLEICDKELTQFCIKKIKNTKNKKVTIKRVLIEYKNFKWKDSSVIDPSHGGMILSRHNLFVVP
jgi:hypothetical protein